MNLDKHELTENERRIIGEIKKIRGRLFKSVSISLRATNWWI